MPNSLFALYNEIAVPGPILYVETEFFGGVGEQAYALMNNGDLVAGPIIDENAINSVLALLSVNSVDGRDRFDSVGLNQYRDTDEWITE